MPFDQSGEARHKCCGCGYEKGYEKGLLKEQHLNIDFTILPFSQAGKGRHKSANAALALGYYDGIVNSY